ncbi:MAG: transposase [Firmicutes bacterium]|nr:transposase [Bacillota bacterium]
MPRSARQRDEKGIHHVVVQGKRLENIFEKETEKELYLETLLQYKAKTGVKLYAFCILDNHAHLVLQETKDESVSAFMRRVGVRFSYWYRQRYDLPAGEKLFRGRYLSEPLQTEEALLEVVRHIHKEPVRQGLVLKMEDYYWSSYRLYLNPGSFIDRRLVLDSLHFGGGYKAYMEKEEKNAAVLEEVPLKYGRTDEEVEGLIQKRLMENGFSEWKQISLDEKREILKKLRVEDEVSIQQLSRVTGVNRGYIQRL